MRADRRWTSKGIGLHRPNTKASLFCRTERSLECICLIARPRCLPEYRGAHVLPTPPNDSDAQGGQSCSTRKQSGLQVIGTASVPPDREWAECFNDPLEVPSNKWSVPSAVFRIGSKPQLLTKPASQVVTEWLTGTFDDGRPRW